VGIYGDAIKAGEKALAKNDFKEALKQFRIAHAVKKSWSQEFEALLLIGQTHMSVGDCSNALAAYGIAQKLAKGFGKDKDLKKALLLIKQCFEFQGNEIGVERTEEELTALNGG
jgi:hypothetical protein